MIVLTIFHFHKGTCLNYLRNKPFLFIFYSMHRIKYIQLRDRSFYTIFWLKMELKFELVWEKRKSFLCWLFFAYWITCFRIFDISNKAASDFVSFRLLFWYILEEGCFYIVIWYDIKFLDELTLIHYYWVSLMSYFCLCHVCKS